ncbi:pilus assembly protein CpaB [Mixta tenebrionis]|uniref:Pilus assembly protein CpaB n=2 Tax=Mixta tenebrionis TaxID=2562439 RepID=A0A506VA36_9GAMM|nr:pilus assembly protein CpaB [Mixta tenebrionis]
MIFFLSIIVIGVGIAGIVLQKNQAPTKKTVVSAQQENKSKVIVVAEATRDLQAHDILRPDDYQLRSVEINKDANDIRDISSVSASGLDGFLLLNNLSKDSAILPEMVASPNSKDFIYRSLKSDELTYAYPVMQQEDYLLSSLSRGQKVSIYIRLAEIEKDKTNSVGLVSEGNSGTSKQMKKFSLSKVTDALTILDVKKEEKKEDQRKSYNRDEPVGSIILRMNQSQLAKLRVVEKAGDILLFPADDNIANYEKYRMDEVLPQFGSVRELRGGK